MIRTLLCTALLLAGGLVSAQETVSRHLGIRLRLPSGMEVTRDEPSALTARGGGLQLELQPVMDRIVGKDHLSDEALALARETGFIPEAQPAELELDGLRGFAVVGVKDGARALSVALRHRTGKAWLALIRFEGTSPDAALALAGSIRSMVQ